MGAGLQVYALVLGFLLFSVLWSFRVMFEMLWRLWAGMRASESGRSLAHATLAASLAAAAALAIQWSVIGVIAPLDGLQLLYATIVPAVVAFGWFANDWRRPSTLFAVVCLWAAMSVAGAAFPLTFPDERYGLSCPGGEEAYHRVLGFDGYPWNWRKSASEQFLFGPAALMELSFWYLVDPQPKC
jgi:hypothetical protein